MAKKYEIIVERDASRVSLDIGQVVPALPAIIAAPDAAHRAEAAASSVEGMAEQARIWAESELPPDPEDLTRKSSRSWALDAQDAADRAGATVAVGNIAALQALEAEADQLAFFDSPGAMALTGLTAAARDLLDDPDAAAMLATLGAFPAASVTAQAAQLLDDTSFAAMLATLGAFPAANVTTQAAQLLDDASFAAMRDTLGLGTAATATVTTSATDTTAGRLLTTGAGPAQAFRRGNILGTVSQSSGVPTGAVIEQGSNANGEYVRFADGTMICTHATTASNVTDPIGAMFRSENQTWEYPASFSGGIGPSVMGGASSASGSYVGIDLPTLGGAGHNYRVISPSSNAASRAVRLIAIGRWY